MLNPYKMRQLIKRDHQQDFETSHNQMTDAIEVVLSETRTSAASIRHTISRGIERVHYQPTAPSKTRPLLLQHGMWHSAGCWKIWQEHLAEQGIETLAYSLPGHGKSDEQRPVAECSLAYYLRFLVDEMARFDHTPILVGHSMGGAIIQWYLRYVGEPPAAAFIASWTAHDIMRDSFRNAMFIDPLGTFLSPFLGPRFQFRNDRVVQKWFLSEGAVEAAQALRADLGPESEIVLMQHRPPKWVPPTDSSCPKFWMAAQRDAIIVPEQSQIAARAYGANYVEIADVGHDIMLDVRAREAADALVEWALRFG